MYVYQEHSKNATSEFIPFTVSEIVVFVGTVIAMGVVSLPTLQDYWSIDTILSHPWFHTVMSYKGFNEILMYLHVVDNTTEPDRSVSGYDKLLKV